MPIELRHFVEKTRIDTKTERAIRTAMVHNNFRRADAIRWLLAQGAMFVGIWPDSAHLNAPTLQRLIDSRIKYVTDNEPDE